MKTHGGLITMQDLKTYEPTIRQPLRGSYRGYEFIVMPPPSSVIAMFAFLFPFTVGVNVTVIVQVAPDAMLDPQVLVCAKSPGFIVGRTLKIP